MRWPLILALTMTLAACASPRGYPSLAPRAAEGIDPRVPIEAAPSPGTVDPAVATALADAVRRARGGTGAFDELARRAEAAVAAAGPAQSESWVAAQVALSALGAQHGVTTTAASDIDAVAAEKIDATRWLVPATREAIEAAAAEVAAISTAQRRRIDAIASRLAR